MRWPVSPLLLVCRGTSTGRHAAAAVASSCTSNDAIVRDAGLLVWAATDVDGARLAFLALIIKVPFFTASDAGFFTASNAGVKKAPFFTASDAGDVVTSSHDGHVTSVSRYLRLERRPQTSRYLTSCQVHDARVCQGHEGSTSFRKYKCTKVFFCFTTGLLHATPSAILRPKKGSLPYRPDSYVKPFGTA